MINIDDIFGYTVLKEFNKFEDGKMKTYGYSIKYGRDGDEVSRTEPTLLSAVVWSDGSPFTQNDFEELSQ